MRLPDLVIPNTATLGTPIDVEGIDNLTIYGPAALTGVISVETSPVKEGDSWFPVTGVPAIAIRIDIPIVHAYRMRLVSTLAEAAERTFPVHGSSLNVV